MSLGAWGSAPNSPPWHPAPQDLSRKFPRKRQDLSLHQQPQMTEHKLISASSYPPACLAPWNSRSTTSMLSDSEAEFPWNFNGPRLFSLKCLAAIQSQPPRKPQLFDNANKKPEPNKHTTVEFLRGPKTGVFSKPQRSGAPNKHPRSDS